MTQGSSDSIICPNCNAANPADAVLCRRCDARLPPREAQDFDVSRRAALKRMPQDPSHGMQYSLSSLLIGLTVAAILFGIMARAPGIGMAIAFCCLPAFVRTARLIRSRERLGRPTSTGQKVLTFVGSIVFALIAAAVVLVASIGTFCTICLSGGGRGGEGLIVVSAAAAVVATLLAGFGLRKWSRSRWEREIDRD